MAENADAKEGSHTLFFSFSKVLKIRKGGVVYIDTTLKLDKPIRFKKD